MHGGISIFCQEKWGSIPHKAGNKLIRWGCIVYADMFDPVIIILPREDMQAG
jgi:hypothetical protein